MGKIFLVIKLMLLIRVTIRKEVAAPSLDIKEGLGDVFGNNEDTFSIMNEKNVSFVLSPHSPCAKSVSLLLMVSSGPRNKANRDRWRKEVLQMMIIFYYLKNIIPMGTYCLAALLMVTGS